MHFLFLYNFDVLPDFVRPKTHVEPEPPKPINLSIEDFNAVRLITF